MTVQQLCPDCGVAVGALHQVGCDVERCPECGEQAISCDCPKGAHPRLPWTGTWPGQDACVELGWFARIEPGKGWVPCAATDPGARPDLNRLVVEARWDADTARYVPLTPS